MAEKKVLDLGQAILGSYGGFVNNNIVHQAFYDDEVFLTHSGEVVILPPIRWVVQNNRLDKIEVNYKSPESLNLNKSNIPAVEHKKFIWKLAIFLYTALYGQCPWKYADAAGNVRIFA